MTTMHEIKRLIGEYCFDLREDSPIQLIDYYTNAHFRYNEYGVLLLGGDCGHQAIRITQTKRCLSIGKPKDFLRRFKAMELTDNEREALKKIVENMRECGLFVGKFDAKNGNINFMYGIETVMEYLANLISEEYHDEFEKEFITNLVKSLRAE